MPKLLRSYPPAFKVPELFPPGSILRVPMSPYVCKQLFSAFQIVTILLGVMWYLTEDLIYIFLMDL
jgi:hypothetical protein